MKKRARWYGLAVVLSLGSGIMICNHFVYHRTDLGPVWLTGLFILPVWWIGKQVEEELKQLAYRDSLTGLYNRQWFEEQLLQALNQARRHQHWVGILFLDFDGFKSVNDTFGHAAGDQLLKAAAARLLGSVRDVDTVSRLGGDEFTILLPKITREETAKVAERILLGLSRPFQLEGQQMMVTASVGVSFYPVDGDEGDTLIKRADTAMYRAKQLGKNNYQFYSPKNPL